MNIAQVMKGYELPSQVCPKPYTAEFYNKYIDFTGRVVIIAGRHATVRRGCLEVILRSSGCFHRGVLSGYAYTKSNTILICMTTDAAKTVKVREAIRKGIPILTVNHLTKFIERKKHAKQIVQTYFSVSTRKALSQLCAEGKLVTNLS